MILYSYLLRLSFLINNFLLKIYCYLQRTTDCSKSRCSRLSLKKYLIAFYVHSNKWDYVSSFLYQILTVQVHIVLRANSMNIVLRSIKI